MKRISILIATLAVLIIPAASSASTRASCPSNVKQDSYGISGPNCAIADAVLKAFWQGSPVQGGGYTLRRHWFTADGRSWHLTWRLQKASGTVPGATYPYIQIEYYRATSDHQLVIFHSYGSG
jgi:hypothetical protein